ncbi:MAG: hypothetical protein O3C40_26850 [Planctomycetota bacterium]|nr:hypothetical protein [Planctomycetota bacterium]
MPDDDLLPIRYLNDLLFCERRAALHLNEQIWKDNQYTTEGLLAHKRVDIPKNLRRGDRRNVTGMWLVSHRLGLIGNADLRAFSGAASDAILKPSTRNNSVAGRKRRSYGSFAEQRRQPIIDYYNGEYPSNSKESDEHEKRETSRASSTRAPS